MSIKAKNLVTGNEYMWGKDDFIDRKYAMQEIYQKYIDEDEDWNQNKVFCDKRWQKMECLSNYLTRRLCFTFVTFGLVTCLVCIQMNN